MNVEAPIRHDDPRYEHARASDLLRNLVDTGTSARITLGEMVTAFGERAFGVLLILFSLPNLVPIPGFGSAVGVPLLFVALQLALGRPRPWLPRWLEERSIDRETLAKVVDRCEPRMRKIECVLKPRHTFLFSPFMDRVIGWFAVLCAISIIIPLPGTNFPPAIAVILISLAVTEEDGIYLGLGFVIGVAGLTYTTLLVGGLLYAGWFALVAAMGL